MLYQHNPASSLPSLRPPSLSRLHCFFYFKLNKRLFTHPRGLKNAWALRRNGLVTYDSWTVFWGKKGCEAFFSWIKHRRAVRKGFSTVCPSLLTLLDGRAATICGRRGRPSDRTATPTKKKKMFVVATVCTQGRRMLWPFDCVAVSLSPSLLHFWNYSLFFFFWK